jgi:hypothetical protein
MFQMKAKGLHHDVNIVLHCTWTSCKATEYGVKPAKAINDVRNAIENSIQLFQLRLSTSKAEKSNTSAKGCWESLLNQRKHSQEKRFSAWTLTNQRQILAIPFEWFICVLTNLRGVWAVYIIICCSICISHARFSWLYIYLTNQFNTQIYKFPCMLNIEVWILDRMVWWKSSHLFLPNSLQAKVWKADYWHLKTSLLIVGLPRAVHVGITSLP